VDDPSRCFATIAIVVAGVCTTAMNWRFSYQSGTSVWDSYTCATFSVALDVTKWLMLPFAALAWANHKPRSVAAAAIWLVATVYSFTAAIGFAALNRETSVSERQAQADLHKSLVLMAGVSRAVVYLKMLSPCWSMICLAFKMVKAIASSRLLYVSALMNRCSFTPSGVSFSMVPAVWK
jgi:hypothetical protein